MSNISNHPALETYILRAKKMHDNKEYKELLKWIEGVPCACIGPQSNDPACPCAMRRAAAGKITGAALLKSKITDQEVGA